MGPLHSKEITKWGYRQAVLMGALETYPKEYWRAGNPSLLERKAAENRNRAGDSRWHGLKISAALSTTSQSAVHPLALCLDRIIR